MTWIKWWWHSPSSDTEPQWHYFTEEEYEDNDRTVVADFLHEKGSDYQHAHTYRGGSIETSAHAIAPTDVIHTQMQRIDDEIERLEILRHRMNSELSMIS